MKRNRSQYVFKICFKKCANKNVSICEITQDVQCKSSSLLLLLLLLLLFLLLHVGRLLPLLLCSLVDAVVLLLLMMFALTCIPYYRQVK